MRFFLALISFCFLGLAASAQQTVLYDSSVAEPRKFDEDAIAAYKKDKAFQYEVIRPAKQSPWDAFWRWLGGIFNKIFSTKEGEAIAKWTLIILAAALLVFAVLKLTGMNRFALFRKKNKDDGLAAHIMEEDIHGINFNEAIDDAVMNKNFRLAVRLMYLQTLKNLTDKSLIQWQINKTNYAYLDELAGSAYQRPFDVLTNEYEKRWYGDLQLGASEYAEVKQQFDHFNKNLRA